MKKIFIIGGGIAGMFCAYLLAKKKCGYEITIIEKNRFLGGAFASYKTPEKYIFDIGIHILYSTSIKEVDDIFFDVLPEDEWNILVGNKKDVAGVFFNQTLQVYSHYPDLTHFPVAALSKYISDFYLNLDSTYPHKFISAKDMFIAKFGNEISRNIIAPILENLWGRPLDAMDLSVIKINSLDRVILHNKNLMGDLIKAPNIASRLAYPDQLNLPPVRKSQQFALYPKKFGMKNFSEVFTTKLLQMGVIIKFDSFIESITTNDDRAASIDINFSGNKISQRTDSLIWCGGLNQLAKKLDIPEEINIIPESKEVIFLNYLFDFEPNMPDIYYFYCYDLGFGSFRVTNYSNFCEDASSMGLYPITIEFWPSKLHHTNTNDISNDFLEIGVKELIQFGVIPPESKPVCKYMHDMRLKFPIPSLLNRASNQRISDAIKDLSIDNIHVVGMSSKNDVFLGNEILKQVYCLTQSKF